MTPEDRMRHAQLQLQWAELRAQMDADATRGNWLNFTRFAERAVDMGRAGMVTNLEIASRDARDEEVTQPRIELPPPMEQIEQLLAEQGGDHEPKPTWETDVWRRIDDESEDKGNP